MSSAECTRQGLPGQHCRGLLRTITAERDGYFANHHGERDGYLWTITPERDGYFVNATVIDPEILNHDNR